MSETLCPYCGATVAADGPRSDGLLTCPECQSAFNVLPTRRKKKKTSSDDAAGKSAPAGRKQDRVKQMVKFAKKNREDIKYWGRLAAVVFGTLFLGIVIIQVFGRMGQNMQREEEREGLKAAIKDKIRAPQGIGGPQIRYAEGLAVRDIEFESDPDGPEVEFDATFVVPMARDVVPDAKYHGVYNRKTRRWQLFYPRIKSRDGTPRVLVEGELGDTTRTAPRMTAFILLAALAGTALTAYMKWVRG